MISVVLVSMIVSIAQLAVSNLSFCRQVVIEDKMFHCVSKWRRVTGFQGDVILNKNILTILLLLTTITALVACVGSPRKNERTLGSLEDKTIDIVIEKDVVVDHAREKAIAIYKDFEKNNADPEMRLEAKRRLADLELEKSEDVYLKELDKKDASLGDTSKADRTKRRAYNRAISLYEDLLERAGPNTANPQIIYQLAKAYESVGKQKKALKLLQRIVKRHSDVPYIGEVQFRLGELGFILKKYKIAEKAYADVLAMGEFSLFYEKALYKHGWSLFKLGKHESALMSFFKLLDRKMIQEETLVEGIQLIDDTGQVKIGEKKLNSGDQELVNDTFRVVNLSLGYLDGAQSISDFFNEHGRRHYEDRVYERLGDFYLQTERIQDAATTYLAFSKNNLSHVRAPLFHLKTIEAYKKGGFADELFKAKKQFVETFAFNKGGTWRQHRAISNKVSVQLKKNMEEVARHYHAKAQKSKARDQYKSAISWYGYYIKTFSKDKKTSMMNFLLAEALFESAQFKSAASEYEKTAYQYRKFSKGAEAGYAALLAYESHAKTLSGKEKIEWRRLSVASANRFGKVYPTDPRAPKVLIKIAEDLFVLKKYGAASTAARRVLELKADTPLETRVSSWRIIAHAAFDKDNFKEAEMSYKVALELIEENSPRRQELVDGLAASVYKQGEQMRKSGNTKGAIAQFARITDIAPDSPIVVTAAYDVAASYMESKDYSAAVASLKRFRNAYPDHELAVNSTENLISAYLNLDKPLQAAAELEILTQYKDNPETKRQINLKIIELYEKAGATDKLVAVYKQQISLYPDPFEQSVEMRQKLVDIYQADNLISNQHYWLREIIKVNKESKKQRTDRTHYLAAKAAYTLALPVYEEYKRVRLVEPLKENMDKKKKVMKKALDVLQDAASYGVAEVATASTFHIAEIYNQFANELMASDRPRGLSTEELEQYDLLLEDQIYPFEEKAIELHESNSGRVAEGIYDVWVKKSFSSLIKLLPVRYAKVERGEAYIDVVR